ncbi:hypothetical protein B296_00057971 [Ensete ventricosum]|uniref:Uncharacterized protein n=1 Tax=Ensete ventricosum TaxID=4639 RepID=A0A426WWM8_ENSVE|nr:hypothetical protein B296_00057971 [Ensete ventricosum]
MLHPCVTQEWVDEGELPRERTKNRRWRRPYEVLAEAIHGEVVRRVFRVYASKLTSDESLGHQHMVAVYHRGRSLIRRDFRGVINPLLSWRESIGHKRGRGGGECKGKLQVPRQGGRAEAKELHKTGVDGLLIKIAESEGLRVDVGVLDQGTK